jgi:deazaflavin-dependent oxidoreductase (nitroreductase family)
VVRGRLRKELAKHTLNPVMKVVAALGLSFPGIVLLETTGRRTGKCRRTPVGGRLEDRSVWTVSEHGRGAGYVRNIEANPHVRVRVGRRWRTGTARLLPDDDTRQRLRTMSKGKLGLKLNALGVRAMRTDPMTVRIDLD